VSWHYKNSTKVVSLDSSTKRTPSSSHPNVELSPPDIHCTFVAEKLLIWC